MKEIKCDRHFLLLSPAGNLKVTEVESVTVHRGWSSAMLLSGGKTASPTKLHAEKLVQCNYSRLEKHRHCCIMQRKRTEVKFIYWMWHVSRTDVTKCFTVRDKGKTSNTDSNKSDESKVGLELLFKIHRAPKFRKPQCF